MQSIEDLRASLRQQEAQARELESKVRLAEHERDEKSRFAEEQAKKEIQWIQEKNVLDSKVQTQELAIVEYERKHAISTEQIK